MRIGIVRGKIDRRAEAFDTQLGPAVGLLRDVFAGHMISGGGKLDALLSRYAARSMQ